MKDADCVHFLQWALPQNQMRWQGFRKVRGQVCKRIAKRLAQLGLQNIDSYQDYLSQQPQEWHVLDQLCRVTISRFYRDKLVFNQLVQQVFPVLASRVKTRKARAIRVWCIGSSSGEEPYTLSILWHHLLAQHFPAVDFYVLATEADSHLLDRSRQACYPAGTIKNLPDTIRTEAFTQVADEYCLKAKYKTAVEFKQQDIRKTMPQDQFDLIMCRNLVFTYFDERLQQKMLSRLHSRLKSHGWLVLGVHEKLPANSSGFTIVSERFGLYLKYNAS